MATLPFLIIFLPCVLPPLCQRKQQTEGKLIIGAVYVPFDGCCVHEALQGKLLLILNHAADKGGKEKNVIS